jgi:N-formylglutamate deformylase
MPTNSMAARQVADIVLGDAHGTTCGGALVRRLEELLREHGFSVRRNDPYAGGYITRNYGRPREGIHAIQIEILRSLYMDEARVEMGADFLSIQARLSAVVRALTRDALGLLGT